MSKKHLILPVVACLMLAGCTLGSKTTKKKKKSSSAEVTSNVSQTSQGGQTSSPAPSSATPSVSPTSNPTPSSGTVTPSTTPSTSSTSEVPPATGWSTDELKVFSDNFHGIVPPYLDGGLDLTSEEVDEEEGYYGIWSNGITESAAETYYSSVDGSWTEVTVGSGDEAYSYLSKDSTDGVGHAEISIYYDETDESIFYIGFEFYEDGEVPPVGDSVTISKEDIEAYMEDGKTYPTNAYSFTTDGVTFNASNKVGLKTSNTSGGNYYYEQGLMQFQATNGVITVGTACNFSQIVVHWYATYASEAQQYHPVVKVGDSATALNTSVTCQEGSTLNGTQVADVKEYSGGSDRDVYSYTSTYNISGNSYFSIGAGSGALYVKDIVIS